MKKLQHKLWHHYRDTPFEVMSVILFSALTFGGAGAVLAHGSVRDGKAQRAQAMLAKHANAPHSAKPTGSKHV